GRAPAGRAAPGANPGPQDDGENEDLSGRDPGPPRRGSPVSAVLDASVLVAATSDSGAEGAWAEEIVGAGGLVAPHLALVEATNILRRLELAGKLGRLEAGAAVQDLLMIELELVPFGPFAERVWELRSNITSY